MGMNKYFKKSVNTKQFGKDNIKDVVTAYVKDTVTFEGEPSMFGSNLTEDAAPDMFVKLTEEKRRERQRRIDAGDETARLKLASESAKPVIPWSIRRMHSSGIAA